MLKSKRSSGAWENLELRLWLQLLVTGCDNYRKGIRVPQNSCIFQIVDQMCPIWDKETEREKLKRLIYS